MNAADGFATLTRLLTGLFFAFSALGKFRFIEAFRHNLVESFGIKPSHAGPLSAGLCTFEALLAATLLMSRPSRLAAMLTALLALGVFTALVSWRYYQEGNLRCHCFGRSSRPLSHWDIARNLLLLAMIASYLLFGAEPHPLPFSTQLVLGALALVLVQWLVHLHETVEALFYRQGSSL